MAEAEQRTRLAIAQRESAVATELAQAEARIQETSVFQRFRLESRGVWFGFLTTIAILVFVAACVWLAPERFEKVSALAIGLIYACGTLYAGLRRRPKEEKPADDNDRRPPTRKKRGGR